MSAPNEVGAKATGALVPPPDSQADENTRLAEFGYTQRLDRSVGKVASFAIGFSAISACTAVFSGFGAGYVNAGAPFVWTLLLAAVVFLVWALIAADIAAKIPLSGYAYQWTSRLNGSNLGWFTGFAALVGWISGMTGVAYVFAGYLLGLLGWKDEPIPHILLTIMMLIVCMLINAYSLKLATLINNIGVSLELVVTLGVTALVGVFAFLVSGNHQPLDVLFHGETADGSPYILAWFMAALGPFFGLLGVEASADVAEETKDARRVIPRTMFYALIASVVVELFMYLVYVLAIRDSDAVMASSSPIVEILTQQLGPIFANVVVGLALTNILVCLLANMLVATRLTYSLSRDNMLPGSRFLRVVSPKRKTPANSIITLAAIAIVLCISSLFIPAAFVYFLGIATLAFFSVYVLQTIGLIVAHVKGRIPKPESGTFDLGRSRLPIYIIGVILFSVVTAALIFLPAFAGNAYVFLGVMVVGGLWWYFGLRPRLKSGEAGPLYASTHPDEFEHPDTVMKTSPTSIANIRD